MIMMRTDPFREVERLSREIFGVTGTTARPVMMPMDAWRDGDTFRVELDLPGIDPDNIDLDVENNVVTVRSEEHTSELQSRGHLVCRLLLEKKKQRPRPTR